MISDKVLRMVMLFIILYFFIYLDKNKWQGVKGGNVVCLLVFTYNITSDKVLRVVMMFLSCILLEYNK